MLGLNKKQQDVYACQNCGQMYFQPVAVLVKFSRIQYPQLSQDTMQPIQTYRCIKCKQIPKMLDPLTEQPTKPDSNLII